jgi:hypothetical protein
MAEWLKPWAFDTAQRGFSVPARPYIEKRFIESLAGKIIDCILTPFDRNSAKM